ncbi:MAG: DinB family protein [Acidobacteriota bacterium]
MNTQIRENLLELLDGKSAHIALETALKGFPINGIHTRIDRSPHTAWELVEHIRLAQSDIIEYCCGDGYAAPVFPEGYWNLEAGGTINWQNSCDEIISGLHKLRELVANESADLLAPLPNGAGHTLFREILVIADHNSYHLGQIMLIRRMIEADGREV